jgi:hypothetical protein
MADLLKWVRLVLDPKSAKQTEDDTKKTLGGIDGAIDKLKAGVGKLGAAIAAAFSLKLLKDFGAAAVREAAQGEKEWAKLGATIRATGADFDGMRESLDESSKAFQAATQYGAGDYLETLDRLISVTGDVSASTANMGLVADVAAQFFDGELAPAADLVAKAMNGNTAALGKMGIAADDAGEALEILATRSFGAAAARAATFNGQLASTEELWKDFLSSVGEAILASEGVAEGFDFVRFALEEMTAWVVKNQDAITEWVTFGIRLAIDAVDVLYRALLGMAQLIRGGLNTSLGIGALALSTLAEGYALALTAASKFLSFIGAKETADGLEGFSLMVKEGAERLREFANTAITAGGEQVQAGLGTLGTRAFSSDQFRSGGSRSRGEVAPLATGAPRVGKNAVGAEEEELERLETRTDRIVAAIEGFGGSMATTRTLAQLLGEDFDALGSEASNLESLMQTLAEEGLEPNDELLVMLRDRYREVTAEMEAMEVATRMEEEAMRAQAFAAGELASALGAAMAGGLGPFAKGKAKQNLLEAAELALRAVAAALTGFGAGKAGAFLGLAAKHTALAGAWGILGASVGGGGGAGTVAIGGGAGGGSTGGLSPSVARTTSSSSANRAQPVPADVEIHLVGPGFNALNPEVQRVVRGAVQESTERYGNARVRVLRRNG